ncbi:hypothetical protein BDF20DRAFT_835461 [Mycotypha africana]|uniref:uncharacterized protein n=1 Tax=Mycotypha africana TaxID=64632 RepID=UPI0023013264|nr:uncharacterized protein BDF20DRAFT_835461 [Mycotypha africana]KAI8979439.1 hypothetical protein BDF20DRAFT_835461 [Mycotypha africana]
MGIILIIIRAITTTFILSSIPVNQAESQLQPFTELGTLLGAVSPVCFDAYSRYQCSKLYPKCATDNSTKTCMSTCQTVQKACASLFQMTGYSRLLPDCSTEVSVMTGLGLQTDDMCNLIPSKLTDGQSMSGLLNLTAVPEGFVISECPSPFIADPLAAKGTNKTLDAKYCRFGCCIPCPAQNLFYKKFWAQNGFLVTDIIRFISAILALFLTVSYLILPDKRRHPSLLILNFSIAVFIFSFVVFFALGNPKRLQCAANNISLGEIGNNSLCAAQGALLIFGSFASVLWCAALIVNLHVHTVWGSNFFSNRYYLLYMICWGVPTVMMATAIGLHAIKFEFANLCLVSMEYIFPLFFYPLAALICPSFIVHIATFFCIARMAVKEGLETEMTQSLSNHSSRNAAIGAIAEKTPGVGRRHVVVAVKIQWRALLLAVVSITSVLFYWLFYMTQMSRMTELEHNPTLTLDWLECMLIPGNGQNKCHEVLSQHIPPFALIIVAEALVSSIGICVFIMFAKRSLWREWNDWIYDARIWFSRNKRSEKHGEQFFAL